ncbi:MAG: hypothetical protein JO356_19825 [Acidobacteria bacterium]|nr:hypothetical protein [Acidobacteriota bacterium]
MWRAKPSLLFGILSVGAILLAANVSDSSQSVVDAAVSLDAIALLVPDDADLKDPRLTLWVDAGREEGLHVIAVRDSDFLRASMDGPPWRGAILPDTIHRSATEGLVSKVTRYVEGGGSLMLVGDAGIVDQNGVYPQARSRFSQLAGVDYGFYEELKDKATLWGSVWGDKGTLDGLGIPPGATIAQTKMSGQPSTQLPGQEVPEGSYKFARYGDETLHYPAFVTRGTYDGQVLLRSSSGVVAGFRRAGAGQVLFINLPLAYLKSRTDGLLLHAFLRHFGQDLLQFPVLTAVPDGIGGMVLNWHMDSNAALPPLEKMRKAGLFEQGPYSIHLTAGPDARAFNDGLGLHVSDSSVTQTWIRYFVQRGNAVGSHGGWIHDYFGLNVNDDNQKDFEQYLTLNKEALERITGLPVREYSAPVGNQPGWVTNWLQQHGIRAYYFTGNASMAPTQTYRDGKKADIDGWSFPISHLGRVASFEEMSRDGIPENVLLEWLDSLADFCADRHTVRLFYSHPPGVVAYLPLMQKWLQKITELSAQNRFHWYTMSSLADFLNLRRQVEWRIVRAKRGRLDLIAQSPVGLAHLAWALSATVYERPKVSEGKATVERRNENWFIVAQGENNLSVELTLNSHTESGRSR